MELNEGQQKKFTSLEKNIGEQISSAYEEAASLIVKMCEQHNKRFDEIFNDLLLR